MARQERQAIIPEMAELRTIARIQVLRNILKTNYQPKVRILFLNAININYDIELTIM